MQHPVGYARRRRRARSSSPTPGRYLFNPWAFWQYAHTMAAAVITGVVRRRRRRRLLAADRAATPRTRAICLRVGVIAGARRLRARSCSRPAIAHGKLVAEHQPVDARRDGGQVRTAAARRARDHRPARRRRAPAREPDRRARRRSASSPTARSARTVNGLNDFPRDQWPDNVELLYYSYHIMVGLGTLFIADRWRRRRCSSGAGALERTRRLLWVLMLAFPFPYIATTAGWMTAELGRQPWLVYGLHAHRATARSPQRQRAATSSSRRSASGPVPRRSASLFLVLVVARSSRAARPRRTRSTH